MTYIHIHTYTISTSVGLAQVCPNYDVRYVLYDQKYLHSYLPKVVLNDVSEFLIQGYYVSLNSLFSLTCQIFIMGNI